MAKFKFRLSTLLKIRESTRDERRAELAQAHEAEEIVAGEQKRINRELLDLEVESRRAVSPGEIDVDRVLETRRYRLLLDAQRQHVARQRDAVRVEVERRRRNLVEANREVRVLEELREKQHDRHRKEEDRLQTKQLDEVAGRSRFGEEEE
jgi:flagellar FliJ protein